MKQYLISYVNSTIYTDQNQRIGTRFMQSENLPTLTEVQEYLEPLKHRLASNITKYTIVAISEIGGY